MGQRYAHRNPRHALNWLLSALFEPPCAACKAVLAHPLDGAVCDTCWADVRVAPALHERFSGDHAVDCAAAIGEYDGRLRDIIHALKYDGRRSIAPPLSVLMRSASADLLQSADAVVPVPLHPRRERSRGFNQSDDLSRGLGVPVRPLLRRVRYTTSQIELPKDERQRNVHEAFALSLAPGSGLGAPGLIIVLVDDVSTTGATLDACARVLKAAGAEEVRALTAARVATGQR